MLLIKELCYGEKKAMSSLKDFKNKQKCLEKQRLCGLFWVLWSQELLFGEQVNLDRP